MNLFRRKTKYLEVPVLYPMGALTFAIACSHCKNIGSDKCYDCKSEKKSGFELKRRMIMLNNMIENTVRDGGINLSSIYRHFKGGYYVVHSLATVESTGEEVVIYQSLQDGKVWTRPSSVFCELVPADKENPTGQKYRFERVTQFNNQLSMVSTDKLIEELLRREDCPIELQSNSADKVWREEYLVGEYENIFIANDQYKEDFRVFNAFSTLEKALNYVSRFGTTRVRILKRVYIKQDFD